MNNEPPARMPFMSRADPGKLKGGGGGGGGGLERGSGGSAPGKNFEH